MKADLIVENIGQLITCASPNGPKRGASMNDIGVVTDGAVAVSDGRFVGIGSGEQIRSEFDAAETLDAGGNVVCPGFVDPHTHIVYGGDRFDEFEMKIEGAEYLDILAKGGGIISTVRNTRQASLDELVASAARRLDKMLDCGTTTAEIKTGYGLDPDSEMKMLEVIKLLDRSHPIEIVPTYLAAHAVPPEFAEEVDAYVDLICERMLPEAWNWYASSRFQGRVPFFADVFCEKGAFDLDQSRRVLATARGLGFKLKAHVDEFTNLGGSALGIEMQSTSIDHLDAISDDEIDRLARSETIGIVTPAVNFNFGSSEFADARKLIDRGCVIALATDFNPGSAPTPSQPFSMAIACRYQKLLPAEALNAATINAAHAVGIGARVGSIEVGKRADFLICNTYDYRQLAYEFGGNLIAQVYKDGSHIPTPPGR